MSVRSYSELRFYGVVKQQYDFSCGSAALATLLTHHYGRATTEQQVFRDMFEHGDQAKIKKQGFSMLDMQRYLAALGLTANGFRITPERLAELGVPAIALIDAGGYRHFVVVKGLRDGRVLLGDPAMGLRSMSRAEFAEIWNGIFFLINRGAAPRKDGFNNGQEWAARPAAPVEQAVSRADLATHTFAFTRVVP